MKGIAICIAQGDFGLKINEKLLTACATRKIPPSDLLAMIRPIKGTTGEDRRNLQNAIAEQLEQKYPLQEKYKKQYDLSNNG